MDAISTATAGLIGATNRVGGVASQLAQLGNPNADVDVAKQMVDLITAKTDFKANLAVIRTSDEMMGALLDIKA